jgi:hypothetical protein
MSIDSKHSHHENVPEIDGPRRQKEFLDRPGTVEEPGVGKLDAHTIAIELMRKSKDTHAVGLVEELTRLVFQRMPLREEAAVRKAIRT